MRVLLLAFFVTCCSLHAVTGMSSGPPLTPIPNEALVCQQMTPNPGPHAAPQSGDGGYRLEISPPMATATNGFTYENNTVYTIRLFGNSIRGFLVQARMPGNTPGVDVDPMLLGSFQPANGQQTLACDLMAGAANEATIAHSQNQADATSVQFNWTAPMTAGDVDFYYTVVRVQVMHYDAISASQVGMPTPAPTTMPPPTMTPVRAPEDYRLQILSPTGCSRASCDLFIGIDTNTGDDGFLDIYMEGTAAGWVAVGFSDTASMFVADVVTCVRNSTDDRISAWDAWNPQGPGRSNSIDTVQDVGLFSGSFVNGRISCTVSKRILPSNSEDLNLNDNLWVIYARRTTNNTLATGIMTHSGGNGDRGISSTRFSPASSTSGAMRETMFGIVTMLLAVIVMVTSL